jgi:hypothetical protein
MNYRTTIICIALIIVLFLCAARPLLCWKIGLDLQWHRARCWSNEFTVAPVQPTDAPTVTAVPYYTETPEPEPSATPEPLPTATWSYPYPLPTMPTLNPYPMIEWMP